jgi:hypothetical protein
MEDHPLFEATDLHSAKDMSAVSFDLLGFDIKVSSY